MDDQLEDAASLAEPVSYRHPFGAVTWVNLEPDVAAAIQAQIVLAVGLLALITSLLVVSRNRREQIKQRLSKKRIAIIGTNQLLKAFQHTVHPIASNSIWRQHRKEPESTLDLFDPERQSPLHSQFELQVALHRGLARGDQMVQHAGARGEGSIGEITTTLQI